MLAEDYGYVTSLVQSRSGIVLGCDKLYLVESRLLPLARRRGLESVAELVSKLKQTRDEGMTGEIVEAMTTNETFFFRDAKPFDQFRKVVLPYLLQKNKSGKLRVWSAACSTGQEPYSISMCIKEEAAICSKTRFEIIGTDISDEVLRRATQGLYSQFEVQRGLPVQLMIKYFDKINENWGVKDVVREGVSFRKLNLLNDVTSMGKFDYILCRNVLIYFNEDTKRAIYEKLAKALNPWGLLVLGGSETLLGVTDKFQPFGQEKGLFCLK